MQRVIVITDTHLNEKNIDTNLSVFKQVIDYCNRHDIDTVIHDGDIFDARKGQTDFLLNTFEEIIKLFYVNSIQFIAIPGNHDKTDYNSEISYLDAFKHHPGFTLIRDARQKFTFVNEKTVIHFIPFFDEEETYGKYLSSLVIDKKKKNILITHIAVNGVVNNDGSEVSNNLDKGKFKAFDKVLVGHYHNRSVVGNVFYIGSAFQQNFGEDDEKGFIVLDENGEFDYVQTKFPKFIKLKIDIARTTTKEIDKLVERYSNSDDNVRFVFQGDSSLLSAIDKNKFTEVGIDVKLDSSELHEGLLAAENDEFISFDRLSILNEFESFCDKTGIKDVNKGLDYLTKTIKQKR